MSTPASTISQRFEPRSQTLIFNGLRHGVSPFSLQPSPIIVTQEALGRSCVCGNSSDHFTQGWARPISSPFIHPISIAPHYADPSLTFTIQHSLFRGPLCHP